MHTANNVLGRQIRRAVLLVALVSPLSFTAFSTLAQSSGTALEEIIVTATRRESSLSKVPISVAVMNQQDMDLRGLKGIDGLARYTPGLVVDMLGNGANNISIRGISSGAGAGTTGVYIDDTPIQVRNLAYSSGTAFPALFDLERVEVLRGPQGTLFGAGSEGGTVRFIQTQPDVNKSSAYTRAELPMIDGGELGVELGGAYGAPIVDGKSAFRVSLFYRKDGGYIDGVKGTPVVLDPTGAAGPVGSLRFDNVAVERKNTNSDTAVGARAAFKFLVTDKLTISPSVTYQKTARNDGFDTYWPALSGGGNYARLVYDAGNPATDPRLTALTSPDKDRGQDDFVLPAVLINWDAGPVSVVSNTSYFDRTSEQYFDFTRFYDWFYASTPGVYPPEGWKGSSRYFNSQRNLVQEVRVQSADNAKRFSWVAGAFYSESRQRGTQGIGANFLQNQPEVASFFTYFFPGAPVGLPGGDPFGAGSSAFKNWFGVDMGPESLIWSIDFQAKDRQVAGFAEAVTKLTDKLSLTTGVRVSRNSLDFSAVYSDPENNQNPPHGAPGPALPPRYSTVAVKNAESAVTPRVGLAYQMNDDNLFYATVSKGFRPPGASQRVPGICDQDIIDYGYVDRNGNPDQPLTYKSDSVLSYEVGAKSRLLNNRLTIDASVYRVNWRAIQTSFFLPTCFESITDNLADATSEGFDVGLQLRPTPNLLISATLGYNQSRYGADAVAPAGSVIVAKDSYVVGAPPPWVYSFSAQYDFHGTRGRRYFFRTDVTHSDDEELAGATDPTSASYQPDLRPIKAYSVVSARIGAELGTAVEVSFFANNLTNEQPDLGLNTAFRPSAFQNQTLRPKTVGVFFSFRH